MATEETPKGPAIIVMARAPRPGEGKTRLRGVLSEDECARLQEAFLRDAVDVALEARVGQVFLAYTPADAAPWADREFGGRLVPFAQQGGGLGARMLAALRRVAEGGFSPLLMIGTDAPLLQPRHMHAALSALVDADVCLGPSADGGYYLLGSRTAQPQILDRVPWGTSEVLDITVRRAAESGLRYSLIETLYDVDTPEDLARLREDLATLEGVPAFRIPKRTMAALQT